MAYKWDGLIKIGRKSLGDDPLEWLPSATSSPENVSKIQVMVLKDSLTEKDLVETLDIS